MRKILISAYGCEPNRGSEPGVGWNWILQMSKNNKLWVLTRANNEEVILGNIPKEVEDNITFIYYDTPNIIKNLKSGDKGLYLYYFFWQMGIMKIAKKLSKEIKFDYSIHLTFGSMWMPTFLPLLKVPFIWGPVGGGESVPSKYLNTFPYRSRLIEEFRKVLIKSILINPIINLPLKKSVAIIVRTKDSLKVIPNRYRKKTEVFLESAMELKLPKSLQKTWRKNNKCNIVYTGRLTPSKNLKVAIMSLNHLSKEEKEKVHFTIIGEGSSKYELIELVEKLKLDKNITFIKKIPRSDVIEKLMSADIFLFPSLREGGSWALMEAMNIGLPVVCMKLSGMEIITDEKCAFQIKASTFKESEQLMTKALKNLINDPKLCQEMGENGKNRILKEFNWRKKGLFMEELFRKLEIEDKTLRKERKFK